MTYDNTNIFARILRAEIPSNKVYEDDTVLAIHDAFPKAPVHVLVMPKAAYSSVDDFTLNAPAQDVAHFFRVVGNIARDLDIVNEGYRLIVNHNVNGGQEVPHFHLHILGGKKLGPMLS